MYNVWLAALFWHKAYHAYYMYIIHVRTCTYLCKRTSCIPIVRWQCIITSAMLSIVGERERTHLGSIYAHARFLSGMVECLASYYCVILVPRPIERVESINYCCDYLCHAEVKPLSRLSSLTLTAAAG